MWMWLKQCMFCLTVLWEEQKAWYQHPACTTFPQSPFTEWSFTMSGSEGSGDYHINLDTLIEEFNMWQKVFSKPNVHMQQIDHHSAAWQNPILLWLLYNLMLLHAQKNNKISVPQKKVCQKLLEITRLFYWPGLLNFSIFCLIWLICLTSTLGSTMNQSRIQPLHGPDGEGNPALKESI